MESLLIDTPAFGYVLLVVVLTWILLFWQVGNIWYFKLINIWIFPGHHGRSSSKAVQGWVSRHVFRHRAGLQLLPESPPEHPGENPSLPRHPPGCRTLQCQNGRRLRVYLDCRQDYLLYWLLQWNTEKQNRRIICEWRKKYELYYFLITLFLARPGSRRNPSADSHLPAGGRVCPVVGHTSGLLTSNQQKYFMSPCLLYWLSYENENIRWRPIIVITQSSMLQIKVTKNKLLGNLPNLLAIREWVPNN